ncbi:Rieske (2Fe-2S) protein [Tahibacter amnicola]|uniref:Rieske (2Fe-2S) protein n=1 Tax=Tahibacter amnicola TaxID=2976241 RepID=A0ABY6BJI4_9GAMM|nr:Rieske (2Fe-2S) protein [Tahibacter amnicola]UXI69260.1 Rieske (2Fe-2S) protein [Tahibacter amnicola]
MNDRTSLCRIDDIPDGGAISAEIESSTGGFSLIVLRQGERVFAYHNECPHAGRRLDWSPGKFLVKDGVLVCAAHGASFDVASGACIGGPCRSGLAPVQLRVTDGDVGVGGALE